MKLGLEELIAGLDKTYESQNTHYTAPILYCLARLIARFPDSMKRGVGIARDTLEIGTGLGFTSLFLASAAKDSGVKHWAIEPDLRNINSLKKMRDKYNFGGYFKILEGKSEEIEWPWKEDKKFGLIYIDGLHTYEACLADIKRYWKLVREGGYLIIHDINKKPVAKAVNEGYDSSKWERLMISYGPGLEIWRKRR